MLLKIAVSKFILVLKIAVSQFVPALKLSTPIVILVLKIAVSKSVLVLLKIAVSQFVPVLKISTQVILVLKIAVSMFVLVLSISFSIVTLLLKIAVSKFVPVLKIVVSQFVPVLKISTQVILVLKIAVSMFVLVLSISASTVTLVLKIAGSKFVPVLKIAVSQFVPALKLSTPIVILVLKIAVSKSVLVLLKIAVSQFVLVLKISTQVILVLKIAVWMFVLVLSISASTVTLVLKIAASKFVPVLKIAVFQFFSGTKVINPKSFSGTQVSGLKVWSGTTQDSSLTVCPDTQDSSIIVCSGTQDGTSKVSSASQDTNLRTQDSSSKVTSCSTTQEAPDRDFCVVTYNCKNMDSAGCAIEDFSKFADVVLVQEHWYFDCQLAWLNTVCPKYIGCGKAVDTGSPILPVQMPRGYGGVGILLKDSIDHLVTKILDGGNRIQCIEVKSQKSMLLISAYMPCRGLRDNVDEFQDCLAQLQELIEKYSDTHLIVLGGDFNENLYVSQDSTRLLSLRKFLDECKLTTQLTDRTFISNAGVDTSTIDYIFLCERANQQSPKITRLDDIHSSVSDHYPVRCLMNFTTTESIKTSVTLPLPSKVKWDKVDKEQYRKCISSQLFRVNTEFSSLGVLDKEIQTLTDILTDASKSAAPPVKKKGRKAKLKVWSQEIQSAVKAKKEAFWHWKVGGRPRDSDHPLLINKTLSGVALRKECRLEAAKIREENRQEIFEARTVDTKLFHKLVKKQRGNQRFCVNELHVNGKVYNDSGEGVLQGWFQHFKSLAEPSVNADFDEKYRLMRR